MLSAESAQGSHGTKRKKLMEPDAEVMCASRIVVVTSVMYITLARTLGFEYAQIDVDDDR